MKTAENSSSRLSTSLADEAAQEERFGIWLRKQFRGDRVIWLIVVVLSVVSLLAVYSSTAFIAYRFKDGNTEYYILKHARLLAMGLALMFVVHRIDARYFSRISQLGLYLAVLALGFALLSGLSVNQASRWLYIPGTSLTFQPSDFAKLVLIMFVARYLSKYQDKIHDFKRGVLPIMATIVLVCGLIVPENLSTAVVLFASCLTLLFIGRVQLKHLAGIVGIIMIFGAGFLIMVKTFDINIWRAQTWISRIETHFGTSGIDDPDKNYQVEQAQIAIATAGFFGKGPGNSIQRNSLPNSFSDFIYAIIIEEYGFLGGLSVLALYLLLLYRCMRIVRETPLTFSALMVTGLGFSIAFQALINMGVAVHLLPVTGLNLPLVSMGGSSMWITAVTFGILLSTSNQADQYQKQKLQLQEE